MGIRYLNIILNNIFKGLFKKEYLKKIILYYRQRH